MSDKLIRGEFYGVNGHCTACDQPLEGRGCPYCGWDDKNPPQSGWTVFFDKQMDDPNIRREYINIVSEENITLRNQLEIAVEALSKYASDFNWNDYTYYDGEYAGPQLAQDALAEIEKVGKNDNYS